MSIFRIRSSISCRSKGLISRHLLNSLCGPAIESRLRLVSLWWASVIGTDLSVFLIDTWLLKLLISVLRFSLFFSTHLVLNLIT